MIIHLNTHHIYLYEPEGDLISFNLGITLWVMKIWMMHKQENKHHENSKALLSKTIHSGIGRQQSQIPFAASDQMFILREQYSVVEI